MFMRIWMEAKMLKVDCGLTWPWNRTRRHQQTLYPVIWWCTSRNQVLKERVPFKQALMITREDIQKLLVSKKSINDITWQAHCAYRRNHSCMIDWSFGPSCWTCSSRHVFGYFVMDKLKEYMVYLPQECPVWLTASTGSTFETVSFSTSTVAEAIVQCKKSRRLTGVLHIWWQQILVQQKQVNQHPKVWILIIWIYATGFCQQHEQYSSKPWFFVVQHIHWWNKADTRDY